MTLWDLNRSATVTLLNAATWESVITDALADHTHAFDVDAITSEYTAAVEKELPQTWTMIGNDLYAECDDQGTLTEPADDDVWEALRERVSMIDLEPMMERHDLSVHGFTATYHEVDPTLTIHVPASEDTDLAILDGQTVPTSLTFEDPGEDWNPEVLDTALTAAGWKRITDWDQTERSASVVRA